MNIKVIRDTTDYITGEHIPECTIITRASDYGTDQYSGVMGDYGVLLDMDDCAIVLEDLHE